MNALRFTGSYRKLMDATEIDPLAVEVASELAGHQYDGYTCMNKLVAQSICARLAMMTQAKRWLIHMSYDEINQQYRVWVER